MNRNNRKPLEHPESRHRSEKTGEMFPMGFGMRAELFCISAIEAAVDLADGLFLTRERVTSAFKSQWGVEANDYESQKTLASLEVERLNGEQVRLAELQKETPLTLDTEIRVLPDGAAFWGWWGLVLAIIVLSALAITNAAAYFRFQAQGWFVAVLMAAPLLFVSIPVKLVMGKIGESARRRIGWSLACVGLVALITFVFTLSARATPPSTSDVLNGVAQMGSGMVPWQLASQIILEFVIATALWYWLLELMVSKTKRILNPAAELLSKRIAALHSAMVAAKGRLAVAEGNLTEMSGSLDYWLKLAETIFNTHLVRRKHLTDRLAFMKTLAPSFAGSETVTIVEIMNDGKTQGVTQ